MKRTSSVLTCSAVALTALAAAVPASGPAAAAEPRGAAVARADGWVQAHRAETATSSSDALVVRDVVLDRDGSEHVRYARNHRGLPVLGGDLVVHSARGGRVVGVSKTQATALDVATEAATTAAQARAAALRAFDGTVESVSAPVLAITTRTPQPRLVWTVVVSGTDRAGGPSELRQVLDAADTSLLEVVQGIETAKPPPGGGTTGTTAAATGRSLYLGAVPLTATLSSGTYSLKDATRGGATTSDLLGRTSGTGTLVTSTTGTFGDGTTARRASAAADAAYGVAQTWDYYKNSFGRNGIANDGKGAPSRVHYGRAYNNAFWSDACFCMTFGDGDGVQFNPLVSLDVAGHEMTHGVTSRTAGLTYSGESGGLNEATSDIFGTMVEFAANNSADTPDYLIGEEIVPAGDAPLRYMAKPSDDGASADCWYSGVGGLDVHYSSGPGNHVFYLLAQGTNGSASCNGTTFSGIGNTAAAAIWYRALTVYMTSSTDYHGARTAALKAATDLYGAGSAQYQGVANAFAGISVV